MRHFHNATHPARRNSLPSSVSHASFPQIQLYGRLYWLQFLWIPRPSFSHWVLVLLGVPVHSENACYHQFKIFCLPVRCRETQTLKYKLQNYNFVWCFTCVWNGSLTLREENRLGMFQNRILRKIFAPDREKTTEWWNKISNVRVTTVEMERQHWVMWVQLTTSHRRQYKNTECCTKMILWRIYVAGSNKTHLGLQVKWFLSDFNQI
jgi:hypothetical protein